MKICKAKKSEGFCMAQREAKVVPMALVIREAEKIKEDFDHLGSGWVTVALNLFVEKLEAK